MDRLLGYDLKEIREGFRSKQVKRKIFITLAGVAIYKMGTHIPLPGLNFDLLRFMFVDFGFASNLLTQRAFSHMTVFSLGISPYISATIIVLLLSGLIPHLRRLRDGNREQNNRFDRLIYPITALISAGQAWGIVIFLESMSSRSGQSIVNSPGWGFRCIVVVTLVSGTMMLVWLAHLITRKGIANGVLVIILAELFSKLIPAIIEGCDQFSMAGKTLLVLMLTFGVPIILIILSIRMLAAKREIPVQRVEKNSDRQGVGSFVRAIPLRVNMVGSIPVRAAMSIMFLPVTLENFGFELGNTVTSIADQGSAIYWVVLCVLILLFTYLVTAIVFNPKDLIKRVQSYGYRIAGVESAEEAARYIDRMLERTILPSVFFLCLLAAAPFVLAKLFGISPRLSGFFGPVLLVIGAVCIDIFQQLQAHLKIHGEVYEDDDGEIVEWVTVFTGETAIDGELVKQIFSESGIDSIILSNRALSATGTLAMWEASRPTFPSLTIHRRLGNGQVAVKVLADSLERAEEVLASRGIMSR